MSEAAESLDRAAALHRRLVDRARATDRRDPDAVLNLVMAVVLHALYERAAGFHRARYVSSALQMDLERDHEELLDTLGLMEELVSDPTGGDDLLTLCAVACDKVLRHVERDERVLYGSLARLDAFAPDLGKGS